MDTSPKYIKMCEKAEEIQTLLPDMDDAKSFWAEREDGEYDFNIWLPRQDQLQEIVRRSSPLSLEEDFHTWLDEVWLDDKWSLEQHWLAFVMEKKFGKIWNGEEWKRG